MIPSSLLDQLRQRVAASITPREAAVDVMKSLQEHCGWLTDEALATAAQLLGLSTLQVEELATFYEMIFRRPVGRGVVHACDSISCWSMGSETLLHYLEQELGIRSGQTTADGRVTLLPCSCLGNCGDGPAMLIGDQLYGRLDRDQALRIIREQE